MTLSAGSTASTSARGPDAITATVPFSAPRTPPETGASICTMLRAASALKMRCAITAPVVERSTNRFTRLPSITPLGPLATLRTMSGVGRLAMTVSTMSATSFGERAATAPRAARLPIASWRVSLTTTLCPSSTSRRAMCAPILPRPIKPISMLRILLRFRHARLRPAMTLLNMFRHKFRAHFIGVLADRRHRSVVSRVGIMPRRRRIGHRPARRADGDAAQMRMMRQVRWRIDAGKGNVGGGELLLEQRCVQHAESLGDPAICLRAAFDALDIGGEIRIGGEHGITENSFGKHAPFAIVLDRDENGDAVAAAEGAVRRD